MIVPDRERHLVKLERKAAFARRGQKRNALAKLYEERHKDLRAFVARGPMVSEMARQMELFAKV